MSVHCVLVTGSRAGIGRAGAVALALQGWRVLVHARSAEAGEALAADLGRECAARGTHADLAPVWGDFSDLRQVEGLARQVEALTPRLDVLWNNAGIMSTRCEVSAQGFELQWAVNHLAAFHLSRLLLSLLTATGGARVINTSSFAHVWGRLPQEGDFLPPKRYRGFRTYGSTKLANVLHVLELRERLAASGGMAWAFHPGYVATAIGSGGKAGSGNANPFLRLFMISPEKGAATAVHLARVPLQEAGDALYWSQMRPAKPSGLVGAEQARALWHLSANAVDAALGVMP